MGDGRDINETLLRNIAATWGSDQAQFFDSIDVFPSNKEDRIVGHFPASHYPSEIAGARVELRIRLNGDLNLRYIEDWTGETWDCQWGRHGNPHNTYDHFHVPPDVRPDRADDVQYADPPFGVVQVAFEFIEDRVGDLWGDARTYPSSYSFNWEYGPDIRT